MRRGGKARIRYVACILCILCLWCSRARAQSDAKELVNAQEQTSVSEQTYIKVRMVLNLDSLRLKKKEARVFTPVLSDGVHKVALRPVAVNGKWRQLMHLRRSDDSKEKVLAVECGKDGAGTVEYTDSCVYAPWMKQAKLWLAEDACGCGGDVMEQELRLMAESVSSPQEEMNGVVAAMTKEASAASEASEGLETRMCHKTVQVTLFLDYLQFPINRTDILPDFGNNRAELKKLTNTLDSLLNHPESKIELVTMTGYASPEGPYHNNDRLAYGRTIALRDYLQKIVQYRELPYKTASVAEDWEGLKQELTESDMPYKEELLMIISTNLSPDEKEERMKRLDRGNAYRILKKDFLPQLRRTVCEIRLSSSPSPVERETKIHP